MALLNQWSPFRGNPQELITISQEVKSALRWWTIRKNVLAGVPIAPLQPQHQIFTDASLKGWGGTLNGIGVKGFWNDQELGQHINVLEMLAVRKVIEQFLDQLQGSVVMVVSDNATTVTYMKKQGGTRSRVLLRLTQELYNWLEEWQITIRSRHIPGRLNVLADALSREGQIIP